MHKIILALSATLLAISASAASAKDSSTNYHYENSARQALKNAEAKWKPHSQSPSNTPTKTNTAAAK